MSSRATTTTERNIRDARALLRMTDCSSCQALCCVLLAFDRSELFAFDKEAGVPCPHLNRENRCRIHDQRAARGFGGCIGYDCGGAGPRACDAVAGRWRDDDALLGPLYDAFAAARAES